MTRSRMASLIGTALLGAACGSALAAELPRSPAPEGTVLYFIAPTDGATVPATFTVRFGLSGMGVAPAGVDQANTGHHHLVIDVADADIPLDRPLPATDQFIHFGGGQTETQVTLAPGRHTLKLVLGNYLHIPHDPPVMSETITVTVEAPPTEPRVPAPPATLDVR
ncbi:MAG: DUF4399 domain-containing protein [Pseudomonadales bacterium]